MKIVFVGAGNLATQLAKAICQNGHEIVQIFSRTEYSASTLAKALNTSFTTNINDIYPYADIYIYAVKDDVLPDVITSMPIKTGIHIHTAGSIPLSVFETRQTQYGVLYPLQTFSKQKPIDFKSIPIFIEACNAKTRNTIQHLAGTLSQNISEASSEKRQKIHLAAVFACNFVNHLWAIADELLGENSFEILLPLIHETLEKATIFPPSEVQTGPAIRNDKTMIDMHLSALNNKPEWQQLYRILTDSIQKTNKKI